MDRKPTGTWAPLPPPRNQAWEEASRGKDLSNPTAYAPRQNHTLGQVIEHKKFGIGVVMGLKHNKIIVVFKDRTRRLLTGRNKAPPDPPGA